MAFCKYCGRQLGDGESCSCIGDAGAANDLILSGGTKPAGNPQALPQYIQQPQAYPAANGLQPAGNEAAPVQPKKKKTGIIIGVSVLLLALIGFLVWFFALRGESSSIPDYEKPVQQYFQAINERDGKAYATVLLPKEVLAEYEKTEKDFFKLISQRMRLFFDRAAKEWNPGVDGDDITYSYTVTSKTKLTESELSELADKYGEDFDDFDDYSAEFQQGWLLKLKVTVKAGDKKDSASAKLYSVKDGKDWMLLLDRNSVIDFRKFKYAGYILNDEESSEECDWLDGAYGWDDDSDYGDSDDGDEEPEEKLMPSLIGMDVDEAQLMYGDFIQIYTVSTEYSSYDKGKIFDQDIKPNDPVRKGTSVGVKVSLGMKKVLLPDLTGWDYDGARAQINSLGLQVDPRTAYDPVVEKGKVISTNPPGPCEMVPGDYVRVTVSRGPDPSQTAEQNTNPKTVTVPNFIGQQWDLARTMAEGNDLVVGKEDVDDSAPEGQVIGQSWEPGEEVTEGTPIMLKVSTGKAKGKSVSVVFIIPSNAKGRFIITLYEDGVETAKTDSINPEYMLDRVSLDVKGTGTHDMIAMLTNEETGKEVRIGSYRIQFDTGSYMVLSYDINGAFKAVGGLAAQ
ncbi:MAG: PASTA domain-containing protein [Oscillospiraceae bacterium]|nr:PASTA domain-containing protein [Oscillospiraceae bacterium]